MDEEKTNEEVVEKEEINEEEKEEGKHELSNEEMEEYKKLKEKDFNFKKLRSGTKAEREEINKAKEDLNSEWQEFRTNLEKERKEDSLSILVGDDEELRKKALYNYNRIDSDKPAKTKDEIYTRMREAVNMEGSETTPNALSMGAGHSGYRNMNKDTKESQDSVEMRRFMKLSDEDKKKYGSKEWQPNYKKE